ncbi:NADPH-dependent FMN reductase [Martelella mediterranea]|uniref:FMN-dependent NADPH-azoreductase n=1 Tax=Martelella mediterranea DSM 17316 TaxID=1122214 RepID=A0A1U9Z3E2_9HYPH|nr:NADPH-dependent FMN reductase [Martelella mediterranea]AQZ52219.1 FMN-dependent NADPH-azoreductase [Martelella mediterranea DSM 17316]
MTKTILGLSGSLRAASLNAALLRAATTLAPEDMTIDIGTIRGVPLYDGDLEASEGLPEQVVTLQRQLEKADGLLLVTPEYNNGIPGVFKNAIDWMSRGDGLSLFAGKPVAVIGASPGPFGTLLSQDQWLSVLRTLRTRPYLIGRVLLTRAHQAFDENGKLMDERATKSLTEMLAGFSKSLD